ncbi:hypothetical protein BLA9940_00151 [Burkholderia aenigmatica]|uniref:Uncharacterized protein n=2 Tax=Burkholderiaceae TaxID=119060 RepID=A0A6J5JC00_9BURK|nr:MULTISPECIES: hypothetical protein [Burkholderia]CAB3969273.1 hypothetical protein BLA3211_05382 [Burkholderia aenigmatica]VWC32425.1 hypothetical protein BLA9940_00151 [Burkholderia aenigmatica]VWC76662.1 hypothetical protein BLA17378_03637 [Burkholderia aenigmatica]VWD32430.1 hypothetical protein BLA18628_04709 [Burkholderia aenigmatica]
MNMHSGNPRSKYSKAAMWLALAPICALLAGCPPLIMPNVETHKYNATYRFPADPQPWLTLERDGISFYIYQDCSAASDVCPWQNLVALKTGTPPDWKNLIDARAINWNVKDVDIPIRRPLSAYVPGTRYRLVGSFGHHPKIVLADPEELLSKNSAYRYVQGSRDMHIESFNDLVYPADIDVQLVIYDDDHQWVFVNPPKFKPNTGEHPTDLYVPSKLFHFEAGNDARLNQPMALYYTQTRMSFTGYRVVSGKAEEWWLDKYQVKHPANQITLAEVVFPSVPLKLDTLTLDDKTVSGAPTLRCRYSHTQFNLGWLDSGPRGGPSEAYRKGCDPYPAPAQAE